jgi:UDP-glucose 4-epimerase
VYVDDVVEALLAATAPEAVGRIFNVGNVIDHSLAEIASAVIEATGSDGGLRLVPWPQDQQRIDIGSFHTDGSTIAEALGWKATTSLDIGLRATTTFYREHPWYLSST